MENLLIDSKGNIALVRGIELGGNRPSLYTVAETRYGDVVKTRRLNASINSLEVLARVALGQTKIEESVEVLAVFRQLHNRKVCQLVAARSDSGFDINADMFDKSLTEHIKVRPFVAMFKYHFGGEDRHGHFYFYGQKEQDFYKQIAESLRLAITSASQNGILSYSIDHAEVAEIPKGSVTLELGRKGNYLKADDVYDFFIGDASNIYPELIPVETRIYSGIYEILTMPPIKLGVIVVKDGVMPESFSMTNLPRGARIVGYRAAAQWCEYEKPVKKGLIADNDDSDTDVEDGEDDIHPSAPKIARKAAPKPDDNPDDNEF